MRDPPLAEQAVELPALVNDGLAWERGRHLGEIHLRVARLGRIVLAVAPRHDPLAVAGDRGRGAGGPGRVRYKTSGGINLEDLFGRAQRPRRQDVRYEITITGEQAAQGLEKDLVRKGK